MSKNKDKKFSLRQILIVSTLLVWLVVVGKLLTNQRHNRQLIEEHHQLLAEFNTYPSYEAYEKRLDFLETKMTSEIILQVCPIFPAEMNDFPVPKVGQFKTEKVEKMANGQKRVVTSFRLRLNNSQPIEQRSESLYTEKEGRWLLSSYSLLFS